jgi:hypothetical protein
MDKCKIKNCLEPVWHWGLCEHHAICLAVWKIINGLVAEDIAESLKLVMEHEATSL